MKGFDVTAGEDVVPTAVAIVVVGEGLTHAGVEAGAGVMVGVVGLHLGARSAGEIAEVDVDES